MRAQYDGWCRLCEEQIDVGEEIARYGDKFAHQRCIDIDAPITPQDRRERDTDRRFGFKRAK